MFISQQSRRDGEDLPDSEDGDYRPVQSDRRQSHQQYS